MPRLPVSLVIPCGADTLALAPVLAALAAGSCWPVEVLVVDAARQLHDRVPCPEPFASLVRVLEAPVPLFPGAARNLGCEVASQSWLAFLDLNTLPPPDWLEAVYACAHDQAGIELVFGATRYRGESWLQRIFISATYGERPLATLPGSLVRRAVFRRVGGFLPGIRAGEDTDWIVRVNQFAISYIQAPISPLSYNSIPASLLELVRKWYRNYRSCAPVVFHLEAQKTIYVLVANLVILLVAFRWNALVAGWQESNLFYVANISKKAFSLVVLAYFVLRGLLMPLRRGSSLEALLPLQWMSIGFVCAILDFVKLLAFVLPPWRNRYGLRR